MSREHAAHLVACTGCHACTNTVRPSSCAAGLLLFTACACGSIALHQLHQRFERHKDAALSALLACFALLYGAAAVRLQVNGRKKVHRNQAGGCRCDAAWRILSTRLPCPRCALPSLLRRPPCWAR